MKIFQKLILSAFFLFLMFPISAFANDDTILHYNEYYSILKSEYSKNGISFEILEPNYDFVYTQEYLDEQLNIANNLRDSIIVEVTDYSSNNTSPTILPYAMRAWYSWTKEFTLRSELLNVPAYLTGKAYVQGDVNLQNSLVISRSSYINLITSVNLESQGLYLSTSLNNGGTDIYVTLQGPVTFAWTDPATNSVHRAHLNQAYWGTPFRAENYVVYSYD